MCRITKKEGKNHKTARREKNVLELPLKTDFTGKVVVVTGAGGVLCGDMARAFAQAGAKVAALDLNEDKVKKLSTFINNFGYHIHMGNEIRPKEIQKRAICIDGDIGKLLCELCLKPNAAAKSQVFHT